MKQSEKRNTIRRLRLIAGQIKGLEKMVMEEKYCTDVIYQSLAVKAALSSFEDVVLKGHLESHAVTQMKSKNPSRAVKEILTIFKLSKKK